MITDKLNALLPKQAAFASAPTLAAAAPDGVGLSSESSFETVPAGTLGVQSRVQGLVMGLAKASGLSLAAFHARKRMMADTPGAT